MKASLHILLVGLFSLFLWGCGGTGLNPERYLANKHEYMLGKGNPPSYVAGYVDGCSTGRRLAGDTKFEYRKNNTRYDRDALYARGWQEGQINCRNEVVQEASNPQTPNAMAGNTDEERRRRVEAASRADEEEIREIWDQLKK